VLIYRLNGAAWVPVGDDIDGEARSDTSGGSVWLCSDGQTVTIGARDNDGNNGPDSGPVRVYDLTLSPDDDDDRSGVNNRDAARKKTAKDRRSCK
jgi:hypothetical protein